MEAYGTGWEKEEGSREKGGGGTEEGRGKERGLGHSTLLIFPNGHRDPGS